MFDFLIYNFNINFNYMIYDDVKKRIIENIFKYYV